MVSDNALVVAAGVALQTMDKEKLTTAVAVALAESGGSETVTNRNDDGTIDVGAWQINSVHRRTHPHWTPEWLKNLNNNAAAMAEVSSGGTNWNPWTEYKNGGWKEFESRARSAVEDTPTSTNPITGFADKLNDAFGDLIPDPLKGIAEAAIKISTLATDGAIWLGDPANWIRIIQVVGGVVLGIAAVNIVVKPVVLDTAGDAAKIITKGKIS